MKVLMVIFALLLVDNIWKDIHDDGQSGIITGADAWKGKLGKIFKSIRDRLKKQSTSNKEKVDQAADNIDRAKEVAENRRREQERQRKEHERRRAHEKAERDERRMNGSDRRDRQRGGGRDRSREKADRDRERMDRMDRGRK